MIVKNISLKIKKSMQTGKNISVRIFLYSCKFLLCNRILIVKINFIRMKVVILHSQSIDFSHALHRLIILFTL